MRTPLKILATLLLFQSVVFGQVTTASFYGTVTDPSGAVIPAASVTLTHEQTGAVRSTITDTAGDFVFDFLKVGLYTFRIEAQGFKRYQVSGMEFTSAQNLRQTFALQVGGVAETVEVTGATSLVNTVSAEQREGMSTLRVRELPLARRNYTG